MFDVRSSYLPTHALIGPGCNRLPPPLSLQFTVRFCRPTRPSTCVVFLPRQVRVCLSSKKTNSLVGPPPFIWSNAVKVPHPNATNTISMPVGTQAPGVPSGNFGKNSENPLQFVGSGRTGNQNRCCFFSSLIKKRVQPARLAGSPAPPVVVKLTRYPIPGLLRHAV
jgi:hypothetical protein